MKSAGESFNETILSWSGHFCNNCFQVVHIIERDFSNPHIQEHLHTAFDNVQIIKVENAPVDESSRKRNRKRKPTRKAEPVGLLKLNFPLLPLQNCKLPNNLTDAPKLWHYKSPIQQTRQRFSASNRTFVFFRANWSGWPFAQRFLRVYVKSKQSGLVLVFKNIY